MSDIEGLIKLAREFGIPIALLVLAIGLIIKRVFVTKTEMDERLKKDGESSAYVEARRVEEREGRLRAEATTDKSLDLLKEQTGLLKEIERELSRLAALR